MQKIIHDFGPTDTWSRQQLPEIQSKIAVEIATGQYSFDECQAMTNALDKANGTWEEKKTEIVTTGSLAKQEKKTRCSFSKIAKYGAVAATAAIVIFIGITGFRNWVIAENFRFLGNQALDQAEAGSFARERLCFPVKASIDHAYIRELKFKQQSPDLCDYLKYQMNHSYYNHLNPDVLQDLIPGTNYLTDQETRGLYNANVKQVIPCLVSGLQNHPLGKKGCYDIALAASETRNHFKDDARTRSKETPGWILKIINFFRYGGEVDFPQIVGKYSRGTATESCSALNAATVRTNKKVDKIAGV